MLAACKHSANAVVLGYTDKVTYSGRARYTRQDFVYCVCSHQCMHDMHRYLIMHMCFT